MGFLLTAGFILFMIIAIAILSDVSANKANRTTRDNNSSSTGKS